MMNPQRMNSGCVMERAFCDTNTEKIEKLYAFLMANVALDSKRGD